MNKSTLNLIFGIVIGISIVKVSEFTSEKSESSNVSQSVASPSPLKQNNSEVPDFVNQVIAPGLQILEVPPPLDIDGRIPYQCYFNGEVVKLPDEMVKKFLDDNGIENSPDVNIHNFVGNLEYISVPVGTQLPVEPRVGRTR